MNVYIETHFKQAKENELKRVEVKIDETLIPWGAHKFLERRFGKLLS